eukprot:1194940-Prorocentrum_minimum.AAC.5
MEFTELNANHEFARVDCLGSAVTTRGMVTNHCANAVPNDQTETRSQSCERLPVLISPGGFQGSDAIGTLASWKLGLPLVRRMQNYI